MRFKLEATIPTTQYGNLRPIFESDFESDIPYAVSQIEKLWATYGESQLKKRDQGLYATIETFTGETVLYNDANHVYKTTTGEILLSATSYKKIFEKPFDLDFIAGLTAKKNGLTLKQVKDVWSANSRVSMTLGNTIHYAMEQFFKSKSSACGDKEYNLPKHKLIRDIVTSFPVPTADVETEVMVSDIKSKRVGQIDAIQFIDRAKKEVALWDYKSDADLQPDKLRIHFIQLSFYASILKSFGYDVKELIVWNLSPDNGWVNFSSEVLDLQQLEQEEEDKKKVKAEKKSGVADAFIK